MDIENATRTRAFVIPLVENWASPEGEPVDEFLHVLEDSFSHDEVWPQPYDHLYVSLRSGRSVGKKPDADEHAERATTTSHRADGEWKVQKDASHMHRASWVHKEMVKVPLMKLKFDLQMVKW